MGKNKYSSLVKFLEAKKSLDDRSLNRNVWDSMFKNLNRLDHPEIIEIGSGTGTMLIRLLDASPPSSMSYTAVDRERSLMKETRKNLEKWASENKAVFTGNTLTTKKGLVTIDLVTDDIDNFLKKKQNKREYDLLIANAFLDLVDIPGILPGLFGVLKAGGMFYFSINYDGRTDIEPVFDQALDSEIMELYHKTMDQRIINGIKCCTRYSGLLLFREILKNKGIIQEAGGSDWCVFPVDNKYRFREEYFLHFIISTIKNALQSEPSLSPEILENWTNNRHQQIERGEMVFITHQLDLFGNIRN